MNPNKTFKPLSSSQFALREPLAIVIALLSVLFISSCGGPDPETTIKKFCSQVKVGESIMSVIARAGKVDFDKYWLEKFDSEPAKETKNIGIIRPRDLEKKTEKLKKVEGPCGLEVWPVQSHDAGTRLLPSCLLGRLLQGQGSQEKILLRGLVKTSLQAVSLKNMNYTGSPRFHLRRRRILRKISISTCELDPR